MNTPDISLTTWAGIMAAGGLAVGFWRQTVSVLRWLSGLFICRVVIKDDAADAVMSHVWQRGKRSPFGMRLFSGARSFVSPKKRVEIIGFETVSSDPVLFWFGSVPTLVRRGFKANEGSGVGNVDGNSMDGQARIVSISCFRGTLNVDDFLTQAIKEFNDLRQLTDSSDRKIKRFNVFRMTRAHGINPDAPKAEMQAKMMNGENDLLKRLQRNELRLLTWKPEELVEKSHDRLPFEVYPYPPALLAEFDEIETWLKQEDWFRSKGIPYRRGYLIHSVPGCGKDTLIKSLAIKHDLPLYTFDLSTYDNSSFGEDWKMLQQNAPCVALLSDIDAVFKGRTNIAVTGKTREGLTFDCLLNTLSGVGSSDGVLLFVTTNDITAIDPALGVHANGDSRSSRPGRIDKVIEMSVMQEPERRRLANVIIGEDWPEHVNNVVRDGEGETAAQFQERCGQFALSQFWENRGLTVEHTS